MAITEEAGTEVEARLGRERFKTTVVNVIAMVVGILLGGVGFALSVYGGVLVLLTSRCDSEDDLRLWRRTTVTVIVASAFLWIFARCVIEISML